MSRYPSFIPSQGRVARQERLFVVLIIPAILSLITLCTFLQIGIRQRIERNEFVPVSSKQVGAGDGMSVDVAYELDGKAYKVQAHHAQWRGEDNTNYQTVWTAEGNPAYATLSPREAIHEAETQLGLSLAFTILAPLLTLGFGWAYITRGEDSVDWTEGSSGENSYY